ncbi:MAG: GAF domain-containing protein [Candidatus Omnitrophica bacterium]|nr:GAF domain-containing protein [Candidatus Omnitrophota bacterium]
MPFKVVLLYAMCVLYVGLAFFVYFTGSNKNLGKGLALFAGSLAFWTFGLAQLFAKTDPVICTVLGNFVYVGGSFVASTFLLFSFIYPTYRYDLISWKTLWMILPSFVIAVIGLTTPYLIKDVLILGEDRNFVYGPARLLWELQFNPTLLYAFYRFFRMHAKAKGLSQKQLLYIVVSSMTINVFSGFTNVFLLWFGIYKYIWLGPPLTLIWFSIVFYAIVRYRLMDIRVAVTSAGLFLFVYALVLGIPFVLGYKYGEWQYATIIMFVLATAAPFTYLRLQKKAEDGLLWEQRRYQRTLRQASSGMGRIRKLDKLLNLIASILTRTVKIEHVGIYVLRKETHEYVLGSLRRMKEDPWMLPQTISLDSRIVQRMRDRGESLIYDDIVRQNDAPSAALAEDMAAIRASLVFPIMIRSEIMTMAVLGHKTDNSVYTEDDISVFTILANQASLAIDNALFYEDMKKTHEQLFKAEKMATIGIMADGLSHQINNRLHAMGFIAGDMMDTLNMKKGLFSTDELKRLEEEFRKGFTRLEENVVHGRNIVQGLMKYTRKGDEGFGPCDIEAVLQSAWEMAQFKVKVDRMKLVKDLPMGLKVRGNFTQLQEVFFNLIDNAYDAMMQRKEELQEQGYAPLLTIGAEVGDATVVLVVTDNGIGVKDGDREKLFTPFFTTKATSRKGTGLGLYVIRKIVEENHGGSIEMTSHYREGTRFRISLPAVI